MNVSMQDSFNLGWKLASVLQGRCSPQLLHTYSAERQAVAKELIDFDREFAELFSDPPKDAADADSEGVDLTEFQKYFVKQERFTAGTETRYRPSIISAEPTYQHLAKGLVLGTRFHSARVIRPADAKPIHLGHTIKADGCWSLFAFSGAEDPSAASSGINLLCDFLARSPESPVRKYTSNGADIDSVIDVRAIFQQGHRELGASPIYAGVYQFNIVAMILATWRSCQPGPPKVLIGIFYTEEPYHRSSRRLFVEYAREVARPLSRIRG
jgi:hypothetical protein